MGMLLKHVDHFEHVRKIVGPVLKHFDRLSLKKDLARDLASAADLAFSDELLLEKFEMWIEQKDDEVFLFHIGRYFAKRDQKPLPADGRDLTASRKQVESGIKEAARERQKQVFAQMLTQLAVERGLDTNEKLGNFLEVSSEQARKYRSGENKPHLATLRDVSVKFGVSIEYLTGFSKRRKS